MRVLVRLYLFTARQKEGVREGGCVWERGREREKEGGGEKKGSGVGDGMRGRGAVGEGWAVGIGGEGTEAIARSLSY